MNQKIIFKGNTDSGIELIFHYPIETDKVLMTDYINVLSSERTFLIFQGEEISLESETEYLNTKLTEISNHKSIMILAFHNNILIGISGIELGDKIDRHIGNFGISIAKEFRNRGIGKLLMKLTIDEAVSSLPDLEIIWLALFANNENAIKMYTDIGFIIEGRLPNGIKLEDGYVDQISMYKKVK